MTIRKATYDEVKVLKGKVAKYCGFIYHPDTEYIGAFEGDVIVGCVAYRLKGRSVELLSDVVRKEYRCKGIYGELSKVRAGLISMIPHEREFAYCTKYSLPKYLAEGFTVKKEYKGTTKVERYI